MTARILLAEDNEPLALVLQKFLAGQGFDGILAKTGLEALQALEGGSFNLLVLDLKLPVMSGVELLRKLRESSRWASLPIIIMSGVYKGEKYVEAVRRLGITHYLEKPFTQKAFMDAIRAALSGPAASGKPASLLDLLVDVYNGRKCGLLALANGLRISFINGEPFSFQSRGREDFPSFLVARGKIGLSDLRQFVESGDARLFLTQAGLLTYDELGEESRLFLSKKLTEALTADTQAEFVAVPPDAESPLVPLSLPRLIYEAAKNHAVSFDNSGLTSRLGSRYPTRTPLFFRRVNLITMRREDIELLELINGTRTFDEILAHGGAPKEATALFHFLLALGMIEFHATPATDACPDFPQKNLFNRPLEELKTGAEESVGFEDLVDEFSGTVELMVGEVGMGAPLSSAEIGFEQAVQRDYAFIKDKNYYEIFGLSPSTFSFNALKEAYFEKTRQYSPDKFMELSGGTLDLAQEVLSHYAAAYSTLSSVVAKERYDEMLHDGMTLGLDGKQDDKLQARIQFQSGSVFLVMEEYENAEKALQEAYTLEPDNAMHCALLAWAIYRNPANKDSRGAQEKARMLLGKSLQNGKSAEAFAFRGWMLLEEGRDGLAEGEFLKALKLNPREAHARKGVKLLEEKREADKKGLFRKIFG
ncbi:MAG TPA: response regulator [Geobacteraceae bacterium]|nr:response regulator [Geobacteraceae bacterium]